MPETRPPEGMPADWNVISFARDRGFGTLRHSSGEEAVFDYGTWNLGDWKPPRKDPEAALPQPGEPVRVQWRRSATGRNVPRLVEPTGRTLVERRVHELSAWLEAVQKHAARFSSLRPASLLEALSKLDEDLAEEWRDGEPREAPAFAALLVSIAHLASGDDAWGATHADWIYADDHRWDRTRAATRFPAMLGLPPRSVNTAGDGRTTGAEQSLSAYAQACNAAAAAAGLVLRLHEVALDGDEHVFVSLPPRAFETLVEAGCLPPSP